MRVAVIGCGYVGVVTGTGLAAIGHDVVGVETDPGRREQLAAGVAPFYEPGLSDCLRSTVTAGTFQVAASLDATADAEVVFLAVQTPSTEEGALDLAFLVDAAHELASRPRTGHRRVVAVRSTVLPGTVDDVLAPMLRDESTAVASNPEFLREGAALRDFREPGRVVIRCEDDWGFELMSDLYAPFGAPVYRTSPATAELAKCTSNALLATLVSFSNEIAAVAERVPGVDSDDVMSIIHADPRMSPTVDGTRVSPEILSYLRAGCGFGGSCLPKDIAGLIAYGAALGQPMPLLEAAAQINEKQPRRLVDRIEEVVAGLSGRRVAVLGAAFKAGTDDLRGSPGLIIVEELLGRGAAVVIHDPLVDRATLEVFERRGAHVADTVDEALKGAAACVITTRAAEFERLVETDIRPADLLIVDGRRLIRPEDVPETAYLGVGRSRVRQRHNGPLVDLGGRPVRSEHSP